MKNYCSNIHYVKICPIIYIGWIVLYYIMIKWEGITNNHFSFLYSYNNTELTEVLFYFVNNVLVATSFISLLGISDIFNKDTNRILVTFSITFILFPLINVYSFMIPQKLPDGLIMLSAPITISPLIIMFNIVYLCILVSSFLRIKKTFYKFYGFVFGACIVYGYLHNYVIDKYSSDIPFIDFYFRFLLSMIPFLLFFILISVNCYIFFKAQELTINKNNEEKYKLYRKNNKSRNSLRRNSTVRRMKL